MIEWVVSSCILILAVIALRYLLRGLSYTRIAAEMGCEMSTVKFHVANMLKKTGLENKLQLALAVSDVKLVADLAEE